MEGKKEERGSWRGGGGGREGVCMKGGGRIKIEGGEGGRVVRMKGGRRRRSYKEKANSNRPIGPYKAVRYLT